DVLRREGYRVGRRQVATLTRRMGGTAVYRTPRTRRSKSATRTSPLRLPPASLPSDLPLSAAPAGNHAPKPCLGSRYHLYSHETRISLSVRHSGLGQSPSAGVAALQYAHHGLLPRRGAGGHHPVWATRD